MNRFSGTELDDLVRRYLAGETSLLPEIFGLLQGPVYSMFVKSGVPRDDAPDVVAQFFEDLFEKKIWRYSPRPESTFWSWLAVAIRHTALDWRRQQARRPDTPASDLIETMDSGRALVSPDVAEPSPRMASLVGALKAAFNKVSEREQDLLRLRVVMGLDYETIADRLEPGLDAAARKRLVNRLKTQVSRALDKLRKAMSLDPNVPRGLFEDEDPGEDTGRKESA